MGVELLETDTAAALPRVLPPGWAYHPECGNCLDNYSRNLRVIVSVERVSGERWLHVSVSHRKRIPNWDELRLAKDLFVGRHRKAIQVLPPEDEYVNVNSKVLHLWCALGNDPLPDFRRPGGL